MLKCSSCREGTRGSAWRLRCQKIERVTQMTPEGIESLASDEAPQSPNGDFGIPSPDDTAAATQTACCPIVGIGASAGGLEAFQNFLAAAPADSGLAYVLIQHLDPNHE